jgi:hypothetical protein
LVLCFITYIRDLLATGNFQSKLILLADDTSVVISHPEIDYFQNCMNDVIPSLKKWFKANKLTLNFDKTDVLKFCINSKTYFSLNIGYNNKIIEDIERAEFLGHEIGSNINWKK